MTELGTVPERLARNRYALDPQESHIEIDQDIARSTGTAELLLRVCPAHVFSEAPDGSIVVQHAACLECGTCLAVAAPGALQWHYPRGGCGIVYREG
jgi:ferredoxin like protein